jgi:hypothetical protein
MGWRGRQERQAYAYAAAAEHRKEHRRLGKAREQWEFEDARRAELEGRGPAKVHMNEHDERAHQVKLKRKEKQSKSREFMHQMEAQALEAAETAEHKPAQCEEERHALLMAEASASSSGGDAEGGGSAAVDEAVLEAKLDAALERAVCRDLLTESQCDRLTDAIADGRLAPAACLACLVSMLQEPPPRRGPWPRMLQPVSAILHSWSMDTHG